MRLFKGGVVIALSLFMLVVMAQSNNKEAAEENTGIKYDFVVIDKKIQDEASPMGYWEISENYPQLSGQISEASRININEAIVSQVNKYKCGEYGDYTFSSKVRYFDNYLLSVSYESMWMCPNMTSPDSDSGAFVFDILTGEKLLLKSEFISNKKSSEFLASINEKIQSKIKSLKLKNKIDCPAILNYSYFYKVKDSTVFIAETDSHSDSGCVAKIVVSDDELKSYIKPGSAILR